LSARADPEVGGALVPRTLKARVLYHERLKLLDVRTELFPCSFKQISIGHAPE